MTHREETHRGVDVHITGSEVAGFFGVYQLGHRPKEWAAGSTKQEALENACEKIDQYYLEKGES